MVQYFPNPETVRGQRETRRKVEERLYYWNGLLRKVQSGGGEGMAWKGFSSEQIHEALKEIEKHIKHYDELLDDMR